MNHIEKLSDQKRKNQERHDNKIDLAKINDMSITDIEAFLADESLSKINLLSIAEVRFGAPSGTLKRHKISTIRQKLQGMINNEKSHKSIAKIASSISGEPAKNYDRKSQFNNTKDKED